MHPPLPDHSSASRVQPAALSRRAALRRLGLWSALGLGLWPGCLSPRAKAGDGRFRFIVVNDLHHASAECDPWFAALIEQMRTHADAELALVCGDLADAAAPASLAAIRDHFRGLGRPIHAQIGNHDQSAAGGRRGYEMQFPGQINYAFEHRGWQFVGLDTTQGVDFEKTRVQPATLAWLDDELKRLDPTRPTAVFTHFPLATGVKMTPLNNEDVLQRFTRFNLRGVFSGHYHAFTEHHVGRTDLVTNRCCSRVRGNHDGSKEKGYWLVTADDGQLTREFVEFVGPAPAAGARS